MTNKVFTIIEFKNLQIKAINSITALRKSVRYLITTSKKREPKINIFDKFKNINITVKDVESEKQTMYIISIVKPISGKSKSIYYKLEYEIEVYRKLANI